VEQTHPVCAGQCAIVIAMTLIIGAALAMQITVLRLQGNRAIEIDSAPASPVRSRRSAAASAVTWVGSGSLPGRPSANAWSKWLVGLSSARGLTGNWLVRLEAQRLAHIGGDLPLLAWRATGAPAQPRGLFGSRATLHEISDSFRVLAKAGMAVRGRDNQPPDGRSAM
jgi:hypothetical protein